MKLQYKSCYTSSNCNQTPTAVHWGKNNLICYASCNAVFIWDPKNGAGGKVVNTLHGHTKRVNSVRWITGSDHEHELVSGSTDGTAIVWSFCKESSVYKPFVLVGHENIVNVVDGVYKNGAVVVVSVSADSTVRIWSRTRCCDEFLAVQTLNLGYNICLSLRLAFLPQTNKLILALSADDCKIKLFIENENDKFEEVQSLKGHDDWVRGIDFTTDAANALLLASSSQDTFIRLWKISPLPSTTNKTPDFLNYRITLESVLAGHEGWVYSACWSPTSPPQLLTASLDKTMIIWEFDPQVSLWQEKVRVGEVGGNTLGFYGGLFGPNGGSIMGHSYHGAFHVWHNDGGGWRPEVTVGGHFGAVMDLSWEPGGEFLVSVGADQTTRVHAPWRGIGDGLQATWHEIARPQVHGYDLSSLAVISRYSFASSAEEKVIRTFKAPKNFIDNVRRICRIQGDEYAFDSDPKGASVPSLGLSNKAVYANTNADNAIKGSRDQYLEESHFTAVELAEPPTEETLLQNTLWPEVQKLYGHGYEVYSLAASPDGRFLASACKATNVEHAAILIWDTSSWVQIQQLPSHNLTVVQLAFSPDSRHLLSVSRDRRWTLFTRNLDTFALRGTTDKKTSVHTRIIWCCSWSHDSKFFATGSRDGKVVFWAEGGDSGGITGGFTDVCCLEMKGESVTAVAFAPGLVNGAYLVAVGLDSGGFEVYEWREKGVRKVVVFDKSVVHHQTVRRLAFRPKFGTAGSLEDNDNILQLASCSNDNSVKIVNLFLDALSL